MVFAAVLFSSPNVVSFYLPAMGACPVIPSGIMFVRGKPVGETRTKVRIVTSVRDGPRIRQRVVRHVGTAAPEARPAPDPFGVDLASCREDGRVGIGVRQAFGAVHDRPGWEGLFGSRRPRVNRMVREMVLARIARPRSKRAVAARLEREGAPTLNLDSVYRGMDAITDARVDAVRALSRARARTLLPDPITVVFHDTTTLYFGSGSGGLCSRGYSRDGRPHRVQVVPALLITPEELPIGYEPFPGDIHEGHTPGTAPAAPARCYPETRFKLVADAGMPSRANRKALRARS